MPIPPDTRAPGDAGHVDDHNNIADTLTALTAAGTAETARAQAAEALAAQKPLAAEAVYYVSAATSASDSNDGLTVRSAKATIAGALTAAGAAACRIIVGAGVFTIATADSNGNAVTLPYTGTILQGQGTDRTILNVSTTVTFGIQAQAAYCEIRDLAVQATTGGTITYGVAVDTPASTGSAEHCAFRDILVQPSGGTVTNCYAVGPSHTGSSAVDVAETKFTRCIATGAANASYLIGNGTSGNILNTTLRDCYSSSSAYGVYAVGTTFTWTGGTVQKSSITDFYLSATKRADIGGFRSENSAKFLVSPAVGGTNQVALRDIIWIGGDGLSGRPSQAAAGDFINYAQGGALVLSNIQIQAVAGSGVAPCFILGSGGDGLQPLAVVATNLAAEATASQLFSIANGKPCTVSVSGYVQLDNATGYAIPSTTPAGPLVLVPSATTHTFNGTARAVMVPAAATVTAPDIQYYTTVGTATWTRPAGAVTTEVAVMSGGSGGGSGRRGAAGTVRCGGGGGGTGTLISRKFIPADLTSTVTVTVGDGGAGGAAVTADNTSGNNGSFGSFSSFGTYLTGPIGGTGTGGTATAGTGGSGAGGSGNGGSASTTGGPGVTISAGSLGPPGGPAGGGITSGDVPGAGAAGNYCYYGGTTSATFGAAGAVDSTAPTTGASSGIKGTPGGSPGSGAASITTAAQAGGAAYANSGAGGAGGGASLNGNASGSGGKGGSGFVLVITFFQ